MIHKLATRRANVCIVMAVVMAVVAVSYICWAVLDADAAQALWAPYAAIEAALSVWNLLVYYERARITSERERRLYRQRNGAHGRTTRG